MVESVRLHSYSFYPFILEFCGRSCWTCLNQITFICNGCLLTQIRCIQYRMICNAELGAILSSNNWYKRKCIDRVYIKVIDCRIQDRMDKMSMNRPLHYVWLQTTEAKMHIMKLFLFPVTEILSICFDCECTSVYIKQFSEFIEMRREKNLQLSMHLRENKNIFPTEI